MRCPFRIFLHYLNKIHINVRDWNDCSKLRCFKVLPCETFGVWVALIYKSSNFGASLRYPGCRPVQSGEVENVDFVVGGKTFGSDKQSESTLELESQILAHPGKFTCIPRSP